MKSLILRLTTILGMVLFCMMPMANAAGPGGGGGGPGGGGGFCAGCVVSSDHTKNTGRCIACATGAGDQCITDGTNTTSPKCEP